MWQKMRFMQHLLMKPLLLYQKQLEGNIEYEGLAHVK